MVSENARKSMKSGPAQVRDSGRAEVQRKRAELRGRSQERNRDTA